MVFKEAIVCVYASLLIFRILILKKINYLHSLQLFLQS